MQNVDLIVLNTGVPILTFSKQARMGEAAVALTAQQKMTLDEYMVITANGDSLDLNELAGTRWEEAKVDKAFVLVRNYIEILEEDKNPEKALTNVQLEDIAKALGSNQDLIEGDRAMLTELQACRVRTRLILNRSRWRGTNSCKSSIVNSMKVYRTCLKDNLPLRGGHLGLPGTVSC
jgi:hypothetical protein